MADWWTQDQVISSAPAALPASDSGGGNWWSQHDTIDAPSIPAPAPVAAVAPEKPLSDRLQYMWDNATPGGPLWLAKTALEGMQTAVAGANAATEPQVGSEEDFANRRALVNAAPGGAFQAASILSPTAPEGVGAALTAPIRDVPPPPAPPSGVVQAAQNIGVEIPHYLATNSMPLQRLAATTKNIPIAGDKIVKSAQALNEGLGNAAKGVEEGFGTGSPAVAGSEAKDALANWITGGDSDVPEGSKAITSRLYGRVDNLIDPDVRVPLDNTRDVIASIMANRQNAMIPGQSKAVDLVLDAVQNPAGLNYQGVKGLRSFVGEKVSNKLNLEGLSPQETSAIYGGLSDDLRNSIQQAGGQQALTAWQRANNAASMIAQRKADLGKIIGASGDAAPEAVFSRLVAMAGSKSSADINKLVLARKTMGPDAWNEVASAAVANLGRDAQGNFSPDRYLTAFGNLSQPGKRVLFGSTGKTDLLNSLEDIATVSSHVKDKITRFANHSGTAHGLIGAGMFTAALHEPLTLITSLIGGHAVADALSRPAAAKAIADYSKAFAQPRSHRSFQAAARNLASVLGIDAQALVQAPQLSARASN